MIAAALSADRRSWRRAAAVLAGFEAVAVALWLLPASVRIVAWPEEGPVRAALIAPVSRLALFSLAAAAAAVLALAWASTRMGREEAIGRAAAALCLVWLWAVPFLPWLPDRWPILLALAGPLRWAVLVLAVAAYAVGHRPVAPVGMVARLERWLARLPAGWAVFGLSLALFTVLGSMSARRVGPGGDEPHYLIISQSLLADGDLRIEDNHQRGEYRQFFGSPLRPDYMQRGTDGAIYSIHAPGLPILLLPAYAAAGYGGTVLALCLLAALTALAVFRLADELAGRRAAWIAWAAVCLTVPFVPHSWLVFPEMPGALAVAWASLWLWRPAGQDVAGWMGRGAVLAALPWLHTKFVIFMALFGGALAVQLLRQRARLAALLAPMAVSSAAWFGFFYVVYGTINPEAPYGDYTRVHVLVQNIPRGLLGLLFDQKFGLLVYSPVYLLALWGAWIGVRQRETRLLTATLLVVTAVHLGSTTRLYMWWGGSSAPARFLVPILPCLAPMIALAARDARTAAGRAVVGTALAFSLAIAVAGTWWPERLLLWSDPRGYARIAEAIQAGAPLAAMLPTFTNENWRRPLLVLLPWLAAAGAAVAAMLAADRRLGATAPWSAAVGAAAFLAVAAVATGRVTPAVREETARRGAFDLIWAFDGPRLSGLDLREMRQVGADDVLRASRVVFAGPGADAGDTRTLTPAFGLPAGTYEARVFLADGVPAEGSLEVVYRDRPTFGRAEGSLVSPVVVPFELPAASGRLTVRVLDTAAARVRAGTVNRVEIVARSVVPVSERAPHLVRAVEAISGAPGASIVYVNQDSYPEGGVFWTRGTAPAAILVAPGTATRIVMTLHLGPNAGAVSVTAAGETRAVAVEAGGTARLEVEVPPDAAFVPITVRSSRSFVPARVDPASNDTRRLGCQVRIALG